MKIGDLINVPKLNALGIVVRVWVFDELLHAHDTHMLEYDADDLWEHWQKNGPLCDVLTSKTGEINKVWAGDVVV